MLESCVQSSSIPSAYLSIRLDRSSMMVVFSTGVSDRLVLDYGDSFTRRVYTACMDVALIH